jgi:hypothetical protein
MKSFALLVVLASCMSSADDNTPIEPGGVGSISGGTGGTAGGSTGSSSDGGGVTSRVCVVTDLRTPTSNCDTQNLAGMTVTIGGQSATTAADGTFALTIPNEPNLVAAVTGGPTGETVNSLVPLSGSSAPVVLPAVRPATLSMLADDNAVTLDPAAGQLFLNAINANGTGIADIEAAASQSTAQLLFEGPDIIWNGQSTGIHGAVWLTNATVGDVSMTLSKTGSNPLTVSGIPIQPGAVTFVATQFP